jgi:ATP-dependent RNA helicase DDX41
MRLHDSMNDDLMNCLLVILCIYQDVKYTKSMQTGWKPPVKYRVMTEEERQKTRDLFRIVIDGHNVPPPITTFQVRLKAWTHASSLCSASASPKA